MRLWGVCQLGLRYRRPCCKHFYSTSPSYNENALKNLCKYLNIVEPKAQFLCLKCPSVAKLDESRLKDLIDCIYQLGFPKDVLIDQPFLFTLLPITLKFRYQVLKECGFLKIEANHIVSYLSLIKIKAISELRKAGLISKYINLENQLANHMTQWPTSLTNVISGDVNKYTLYTLRLKIIQRYLELVLDITSEEFYRGINTYPTIKHRPLKAINETLNILQSQIMMPNHKIKSNFYLIHVDPENLKNVIFNLRTIGGIDIKEVIRMHPRLATKNYNTLVEIKNVLQEYGITNEAQRRCFDIYTLGPSTVKERLEKAKSIPEFAAYSNHPRFLKMIHYNKIAMKRLRNLYDINKKCLSLNILSGSSANFETFEKSPGDRLGKGKDLLFCISQSLGKGYSARDLHKILRRHPFWINIPLVQVKYVYEQLSRNFTEKDIYENCPILLYPWSKIRETLNCFKFAKTNQCQHFHEHLDISKLTRSQKLSVALYLLEKKHYFSGNGIWTEEKSKNIVDLSQLPEIKSIHSKKEIVTRAEN